MNFSDFLGKSPLDNAENLFSQYGIQNWNYWQYANQNLVIGENGAGKSRLLKAVRDICIENNILCIYMDFTQVSGSYVKNREINKSLLTEPLFFPRPVK